MVDEFRFHRHQVEDDLPSVGTRDTGAHVRDASRSVQQQNRGTSSSRLNQHPNRDHHAYQGEQLFPELAAFMGGYFHQDFDINGDTLEEVVAVFIADCDTHLRCLLIADIDGFLDTGDAGMEERFEAYFRPDVIPTGFRSSTREFLLAIRGELVGVSGI